VEWKASQAAGDNDDQGVRAKRMLAIATEKLIIKEYLYREASVALMMVT
jgi:hypothetical protein